MGAADDPDDADGGRPNERGPATETDGGEVPEEPDIGDVLDRLEELEESVDPGEERRKVREVMRTARQVRGGVFGRVIRGYDLADAAESLLGALLFGIPMAVEGGTNEAGAFLATRPALLVGTVAVAVGMVAGILYVTDIQDVRVYRPFLGVVPRRLVAVPALAFGTAAVLLTVWGRVDWADPQVALATVVVAFVPMSIGAALGDILPGS